METENVCKKKILIEEAREAARRGDAAGMVKSLFASGAINDLVWTLRRQFHRTLASQVTSDCIADAIADCYAALAGGKAKAIYSVTF